jgi:putative redox protein
MEATLHWIKGHQFLAEDGDGGAIVIDAQGAEGSKAGFKPTALLLASLGACTAYDVVDILRKQRQDLRGLRIQVEGDQEPEPPWPFTAFRLRFELRGHALDPGKARRAVDLAVTKYCAVAASLKAPVTAEVAIAEA